MNLLISLMSFLSSLFQPAEEPAIIPEDHPLTPAFSDMHQYIIPEVDKALPGLSESCGCWGGVGIEHITINISCSYRSNEDEMKRISFTAHRAAQSGLKRCERLYNVTNHGSTSPNLIYIELSPESIEDAGAERAGIHNSQFCPPGYLAQTQAIDIFKTRQWPDVLKNRVTDEQKRFFQAIRLEIAEVGECSYASVYTTEIELGVKAVGLSINLIREKIDSAEVWLKLYRDLYERLQRVASSFYSDHFLMLEVFFEEPDNSIRGWGFHNVRGHVSFYRRNPDKFCGVKGNSWCYPHFIDDLIPENLRRKYYR